MKMNIYSLFDGRVCAFGQPFFCLNDGAAMRTINEAAKDQRSMIAKYPMDFSLFRIGTFDDNTGILTPTERVDRGSVQAVLEYFVNLDASERKGIMERLNAKRDAEKEVILFDDKDSLTEEEENELVNDSEEK